MSFKESVSRWLVKGRHDKECKIYVITIDDLFAYTGGNWRRTGYERVRMTYGRIGCRQSEVGGCLLGQKGLRGKTGVKYGRNLLLQGLWRKAGCWHPGAHGSS